MPYKRIRNTPPTAVSVFSAEFGPLVIFKDEQVEPYTEMVEVTLEDAEGKKAYTKDGSNHAYFAEGETIPAGYELVIHNEPKSRERKFTSRFNGVQLVEKSVDGQEIREVSASQGDIPKTLFDAYVAAAKAIAVHMIQNKPA